MAGGHDDVDDVDYDDNQVDAENDVSYYDESMVRMVVATMIHDDAGGDDKDEINESMVTMRMVTAMRRRRTRMKMLTNVDDDDEYDEYSGYRDDGEKREQGDGRVVGVQDRYGPEAREEL